MKTKELRFTYFTDKTSREQNIELCECSVLYHLPISFHDGISCYTYYGGHYIRFVYCGIGDYRLFVFGQSTPHDVIIRQYYYDNIYNYVLKYQDYDFRDRIK